MAIGKSVVELQAVIGYSFNDISLLQNALTHSSYAYEQKSRGIVYPSNERLEFLGDTVLELVISEHLYDKFKNKGEGALTKMRQGIVCEKTLSQIALGINLGDYASIKNGSYKKLLKSYFNMKAEQENAATEEVKKPDEKDKITTDKVEVTDTDQSGKVLASTWDDIVAEAEAKTDAMYTELGLKTGTVSAGSYLDTLI